MKTKPIHMPTAIRVALMLTTLCTPLFAGSNARADRELEIMTGILETTLGFLNEPASGRTVRSFGSSDVEGYLLPGQGVVFLVSLEQRSSWPMGLLEAAELADLRSTSDKELFLADAGVRDLKASLQREQQKTKERLEKQHRQLQDAKRLLVEAVAEYGDSFSTLEDDDFINLILRIRDHSGPLLVGFGNTALAGSESSSPGSEVLAIRRSEIREYKAGSISLDQLTAKALQR